MVGQRRGVSTESLNQGYVVRYVALRCRCVVSSMQMQMQRNNLSDGRVTADMHGQAGIIGVLVFHLQSAAEL